MLSTTEHFRDMVRINEEIGKNYHYHIPSSTFHFPLFKELRSLNITGTWTRPVRDKKLKEKIKINKQGIEWNGWEKIKNYLVGFKMIMIY
ncbi:MAG: hypothetical protein PHV06_00370 [bacterium]|nr:hypothetical protein [bacterium]